MPATVDTEDWNDLTEKSEGVVICKEETETRYSVTWISPIT